VRVGGGLGSYERIGVGVMRMGGIGGRGWLRRMGDGIFMLAVRMRIGISPWG
jgi:hypothetical protein